MSSRKQGAKESLDSYIEFINSTCQRLGVSKADQLHFFEQGLKDDIKQEVLMYKPEDYQTAENLARLKVSVDRMVAESSQESTNNDGEKEILYRLLDKLTPTPATPAGSGTDKKVAAFDVSDRSSTDLSSEFRKLCVDLHQELREEMRSLKDGLLCFQGPQFSRYSQSPRRDPNPCDSPQLYDVRSRGMNYRPVSRSDGMRSTCYRCGLVGHLARYCGTELPSDHDISTNRSERITHNGLYESNVLPFGLCNSPATFQRLMTHALRGLEWDICLVYSDDLIIFSRTFDNHLLHLEKVFKHLQEANVRLKPSKCYFVQSKVEYLGHIVTAEGLSPNPQKIQAVKEFPTLTNIPGVKAFLGLCNYYRRFVKGFAQIASPLNKLTSKYAKFEWTDHCQEAFEALKKALISAPILAYPDFTQPFHLYVDASQAGIGMTLHQNIDKKETVVAYAGRDFHAAERNYSATEREALAVIDGIKRFQSYFYGRKFYVHTDHSALKWLMSVQDPTGRIARWSLLIQ